MAARRESDKANRGGLLSRTVAIANQKGGVGKTTTSVNLAGALAVFERRVLLVDCDPQGNASRGLRIEVEPAGTGLYEVMRGEISAQDCIRQTSLETLSVLPANRDLVGIEVEFAGASQWHLRLRDALLPVVSRYDHVLLDCPPSLGHLTVSALSAANGVLVPLQCEYYALEGVTELLGTLGRIRETLNPQLSIAGILLTMYDERTNLSKDVATEVRKHFPGQVYNTVIPRNVRLAEAPSHGVSVFEYDVASRGAQAYLALAQEFMRRAV